MAAKTMLASCLDHTALLGGYGISGIDPVTGEREYTPFRHSTSWINLTCGNRWKIHLYAGYTKNLGSTKPLVSGEKYGVGLDIDQLCSGNIAFSYNLPHWQFGVEYVPSTGLVRTDRSVRRKGSSYAYRNQPSCVGTYDLLFLTMAGI